MFDNLVDHHKVHKVETAGDCYIVAGGIIQPDDDGFYDLVVGGPVGGRLAPAAPSRWVGRWEASAVSGTDTLAAPRLHLPLLIMLFGPARA